MRIVKPFNEAYEAMPDAEIKILHAKQQEILDSLNAPVYLGRFTNVAYDHKTDRYAVTAVVKDNAKLTLKTATPVVEFISQHISESGYWQGRLQDGVLVDVYLIQAG